MLERMPERRITMTVSKWYKYFKLGPTLRDVESSGDWDDFNISVRYNVTAEDGSTVQRLYELEAHRVFDELMDKYSEWSIVTSIYRNKAPLDYTMHTWNNFKATWIAENLPYILSSMLANYNPVDNYGGWEVEDTTGKSRGHQSGKIKQNSSVNTSATSSGEVNHYETTYDDTSNDKLKWRETQDIPSSSVSGSADNNFTDYGTMNEGTDGRIIIDNNHVMNATDASGTRNLYRHGNMGTTMTQQMIEAELNVRKTSIIDLIVDNFAHQNLVYLPEGDD